jgi:hypothetical protein
MKHDDALWLAAGAEGSAEGIGAGDSRVVTREPRSGAMPLLVVFSARITRGDRYCRAHFCYLYATLAERRFQSEAPNSLKYLADPTRFELMTSAFGGQRLSRPVAIRLQRCRWSCAKCGNSAAPRRSAPRIRNNLANLSDRIRVT